MMYVEVEVPELTKDCVMIYAEVLPDAASEEQ